MGRFGRTRGPRRSPVDTRSGRAVRTTRGPDAAPGGPRRRPRGARPPHRGRRRHPRSASWLVERRRVSIGAQVSQRRTPTAGIRQTVRVFRRSRTVVTGGTHPPGGSRSMPASDAACRPGSSPNGARWCVARSGRGTRLGWRPWRTEGWQWRRGRAIGLQAGVRRRLCCPARPSREGGGCSWARVAGPGSGSRPAPSWRRARAESGVDRRRHRGSRREAVPASERPRSGGQPLQALRIIAGTGSDHPGPAVGYVKRP